MTKPRSKIISLACAASLASATLAACGGGDEVSPDEYVGSICSAFGEFQATILEGQSTVQEAAAGGLDAEQGKEQLSSFFGDASEASEETATRVEEAGTPDVDNGEEIAGAVNSAFDEITQAFEDAQAEVDSLPTDADRPFATAAQELGTTFQDTIAEVGEGLEQVGNSPELEQAAEDSEECQNLQSAAAGATGATGP